MERLKAINYLQISQNSKVIVVDISMLIAEKNSPAGMEVAVLLKKHICKECEDEVNQKGYLTKHQY